MAKFKAVPMLDQIVAQMIAPEVGRIADKAGHIAKTLAPPTKTWESMRDLRVRKPHVHADGDELPDNLRFKLTAFAWDLENAGAVPIEIERNMGGGGGWEGPDPQTVPGVYSYLRYPRDTSQGHYVQIVNCRCFLVMDPQGVAKMVRVTEPQVVSTKVTATVIAEGDYVIQAERGDTYDWGLKAEGTYFMRRTVAVMGASG